MTLLKFPKGALNLMKRRNFLKRGAGALWLSQIQVEHFVRAQVIYID